MAINVPVNSAIEVRFVGKMFGQQVMNVLHYFVEDQNIPDFADFVQNVWGPWFEDIQNPYSVFIEAISANVEELSIIFQAIHPTRFRAVTFLPNQRSGQGIGASLPQNVAVTITKRADAANRHAIGSFHVPGILTVDTAQGQVLVGSLPAFQAIGDALVKTFEPVGGPRLTPVIYNRAAPDESLVVTQASPQRPLRVMRRRTVGLGS